MSKDHKFSIFFGFLSIVLMIGPSIPGSLNVANWLLSIGDTVALFALFCAAISIFVFPVYGLMLGLRTDAAGRRGIVGIGVNGLALLNLLLSLILGYSFL